MAWIAVVALLALGVAGLVRVSCLSPVLVVSESEDPDAPPRFRFTNRSWRSLSFSRPGDAPRPLVFLLESDERSPEGRGAVLLQGTETTLGAFESYEFDLGPWQVERWRSLRAEGGGPFRLHLFFDDDWMSSRPFP